MLLPELDKQKCRDNAREVLKQYRRKARIAGQPLTTLKSPTSSDMPKAVSVDNSMEQKYVDAISANQDINFMLRAFQSIRQINFQVLYYTYLDKEVHTDLEISSIVFNSLNATKTVERRRSEALIEFSEAYRHGELLVYKN
ncbi:ArpU family phage packaging/lysis transcriptional regulator [Latilactobacillus curvatus]